MKNAFSHVNLYNLQYIHMIYIMIHNADIKIMRINNVRRSSYSNLTSFDLRVADTNEVEDVPILSEVIAVQCLATEGR